MKNETFYFSHDYNARNDRKILKLRQKAKLPGLAIFWCLIEMMYEDGGKIPLADIPTIATELRAKISQVESVVNDFGLFKKDSEHFWSESVKRRIDKRNEKSTKARDLVKKRWSDGREDSRVKAENCLFYIIKIYSKDESFIKVGITSESVSRRYSGKLNGYEFDLIWKCENNTMECLSAENEIAKNFAKYTPNVKFPGSLECYKLDDLQGIINEAMRNLDSSQYEAVSLRNTIKERKGKENKGKESNEGKVVAIAPDRKRFVKPTEIDLIEYFVKIGLDDFTAQAQAKKFIDCYETNGWKVGKSKAPMQNWKTAANGWKDRMNNYTNNGYGNQANKGFNDSAKPGTSAARIEALKNW